MQWQMHWMPPSRPPRTEGLRWLYQSGLRSSESVLLAGVSWRVSATPYPMAGCWRRPPSRTPPSCSPPSPQARLRLSWGARWPPGMSTAVTPPSPPSPASRKEGSEEAVDRRAVFEAVTGLAHRLVRELRCMSRAVCAPDRAGVRAEGGCRSAAVGQPVRWGGEAFPPTD